MLMLLWIQCGTVRHLSFCSYLRLGSILCFVVARSVLPATRRLPFLSLYGLVCCFRTPCMAHPECRGEFVNSFSDTIIWILRKRPGYTRPYKPYNIIWHNFSMLFAVQSLNYSPGVEFDHLVKLNNLHLSIGDACLIPRVVEITGTFFCQVRCCPSLLEEKAAFWRIQQWPASIAFWRAVPFTMGSSQKNRRYRHWSISANQI